MSLRQADDVRSGRVLLFQGHQHGSGRAHRHGRAAYRVDHTAADARVIGADLPGREHGLQPVLPISLLHDRSTRVEVDIEIDVLLRADRDRTAHNLSRRNLQSGIGLAGKIELVDAAIVQHNTIEALSRAGVGDRQRAARAAIGHQQQTNLLVSARGEGCVGPQRHQQAGIRSQREKIDLHGLRIELRRKLLPAR
jgi:hypothetical protein